MAALALPLVLVTACGDDTGPTATEPTSTTDATQTPTDGTSTSPSNEVSTPADDTSPKCDDVWIEGERLPGGYQGCYEGAKLVKADGRYCEFGKPLFTYDLTYYAVRKGIIAKAEKSFAQDPGYQDALAKCTA